MTDAFSYLSKVFLMSAVNDLLLMFAKETRSFHDVLPAHLVCLQVLMWTVAIAGCGHYGSWRDRRRRRAAAAALSSCRRRLAGAADPGVGQERLLQMRRLLHRRQRRPGRRRRGVHWQLDLLRTGRRRLPARGGRVVLLLLFIVVADLRLKPVLVPLQALDLVHCLLVLLEQCLILIVAS